ncbi:hypothetical protein [Phytohabitans suffuscus]|uniref:EcsC family protein n=1 Tax=Phytohabitans suffuscus TaxID=624315 RepID=A0A6F8YP07_9ACTN|nr:hypothetical protein [Phytohabitans suffuscus]BCB87852.1 hypothetical protein Psuf_051650 [Phytohabitans suffuscus]
MTDKAPESGVDPELSKAIAALGEEGVPAAERRRLLRRVAGRVPIRRIGSMFRPKVAVRWMADTVADVAPYIPVRDLETLRRHHDGLDGEALADRLVRNASRVTAGVGAAGGGIAAVEWAATPTLMTAPVLLAAETVAVVAVEIKLIGELHEVYRTPVPGTGAQRAIHLVHAWSQQRGFNPLTPGVGIGAVLGTAARKELRDRLLRRFGRNLTTLGPLLTGAAVAGYLNRRATNALGDRIRDDLRRGRPAIEGKVVSG